MTRTCLILNGNSFLLSKRRRTRSRYRFTYYPNPKQRQCYFLLSNKIKHFLFSTLFKQAAPQKHSKTIHNRQRLRSLSCKMGKRWCCCSTDTKDKDVCGFSGDSNNGECQKHLIVQCIVFITGGRFKILSGTAKLAVYNRAEPLGVEAIADIVNRYMHWRET